MAEAIATNIKVSQPVENENTMLENADQRRDLLSSHWKVVLKQCFHASNLWHSSTGKVLLKVKGLGRRTDKNGSRTGCSLHELVRDQAIDFFD